MALNVQSKDASCRYRMPTRFGIRKVCMLLKFSAPLRYDLLLLVGCAFVFLFFMSFSSHFGNFVFGDEVTKILRIFVQKITQLK